MAFWDSFFPHVFQVDRIQCFHSKAWNPRSGDGKRVLQKIFEMGLREDIADSAPPEYCKWCKKFQSPEEIQSCTSNQRDCRRLESDSWKMKLWVPKSGNLEVSPRLNEPDLPFAKQKVGESIERKLYRCNLVSILIWRIGHRFLRLLQGFEDVCACRPKATQWRWRPSWMYKTLRNEQLGSGSLYVRPWMLDVASLHTLA